jgi:uncharacterized membrane protein YjfL (UPF0719 family)
MSGDEVLMLIVSGLLGLFGWKVWGGGLFLALQPRNLLPRFLAWVSPLLSGSLMLLILRRWASHDVRSDSTYLFFYMVMWFGWTGIMNRLLQYTDLNCRDDALERGNAAAAFSVSGALIGVTLAFAGGNIGDGPGWWVVVFCAGLSTGALIVLWIIGSSISRVADAITIDRDVAAGWRVLGFFVGGGLIVGRSVAGDWHSAGQTVSDFLNGAWPILLLWVVAVVLDILCRPTPQKPARNIFLYGIIPFTFYLAFGIGVVAMQGSW